MPYIHRRMGRGGAGWVGGGGAAAPPPPAFGQLSFLGSGGPFLGQQQWWEGGVFQFSGGRMTSRGQCPREGVLVNVQERGSKLHHSNPNCFGANLHLHPNFKKSMKNRRGF